MQSIPSTIIIISWAAFLLFWIFSSFGVKRDVGGRPWWRGWRGRILAVAVIILVSRYSKLGNFTYHIGPLSSVWSQTQSTTFGIIGSALSVLGVGLAIWARIYLGRNWSSHPTLKEDHELVTSGPYAFIRHPIYTGVIAAALGTAFVSAYGVFFFIAACIVFISRVGREEKLMMKQFPNQYPEYKKRTWALVPYIW